LQYFKRQRIDPFSSDYSVHLMFNASRGKTTALRHKGRPKRSRATVVHGGFINMFVAQRNPDINCRT